MKRLLHFLAILLFSTSLFAQANWKQYRSTEKVNDLYDFGDYLWLATNAGLVEMDKNTLEKNWSDNLNSDLPSPEIEAIAIDPNGNPWIGTYDVVIAMHDGAGWTNLIDVNAEFPSTHIDNLFSMTFDDNGVLWIGTNKGVVRYSHPDWELFYPGNTSESFLQDVRDISPDGQGNIYVAALHNYRYDGSTWHDLQEDMDYLNFSKAKWHLSENGIIWNIDPVQGLSKFDGNSWETFLLDDDALWSPNAPSSDLVALAKDESDHIWLITESDGIFELENGIWQHNSLLSIENVTHFYQDENLDYWINQENYFTRWIDLVPTQTNISQYALESNLIRKILRNEAGHTYIINGNRDVSFHNGNNWTALETPFENYPGLTANDMLFDNNGNLWFATTKGLFLKNSDGWTQLLPDGVYEVSHCLALDSEGKLWVSHVEGLSYYDGNDWTHYNSSNAPIAAAVLQVQIDNNDVVWATTGDGKLLRLENETWVKYSSSNSPLPPNYTPQIHVDSENNLWATANDAGVLKYSNPGWSHVDHSNSDILSDKIHALSSDQNGKIYFGSLEGISILDGNTWGTLEALEEPLYWDFYTALLVDENNTLWIGQFENGLFAFNENGIPVNVSEKEEAKQFSLNLFPNPSSDWVNIQVEIPINVQDAKLQLVDLTGKVLTNKNFSFPNGHVLTALNISNFPSGIYLIHLKMEDQSVFKKLVIR